MNRTFPDNVKFRKSADPCLQKTLYNVLVAYGRHNQGVGYCQVSPQGKVTATSKDALTLFTGSLVMVPVTLTHSPGRKVVKHMLNDLL